MGDLPTFMGLAWVCILGLLAYAADQWAWTGHRGSLAAYCTEDLMVEEPFDQWN